ncbi:protein spaetzle isoform X2 [Aricia agestis]|uniref:protein spaetzle isoform X2 n=1 Tax=Aricia agestis TaxID=91739 RepID=UPI001C206908|nr:protein spaetzle isoform X2 [Aricia agestis]
MAWIYRYVLWIMLMNVSLSLKPQDGDAERNWGESRKLSGSYKIVNRRTRPTANKRGTEGGPFVFPGVSSRIGEAEEIQVPEECQKTGICEDLPDYPEDVVKSLVDDLIQRNATTIFNNDVLFPPQLAERIGADDIDIELCTSKLQIFTPRAAKTVDDKWHYILNPKGKPKQTFRVEICMPGDSPCSNNNPPIMSFQTGYTSYCEQKYSLREMIALDSNHQLIKDSFQVPTCCSCLLKQL